jgi:hypothetical protein
MSDALRRLGTISIGDAVLIVPAEVAQKPIEETPKALANDAPSADIARLEALKAEIRAARQVLHAEIGAVSPILGEIFRTWPEAVIVGTADGPPSVEQRTIVPEKPPSPQAVERRARELLARAEQTLGITISDRSKALDYYRCRATAELTRRKGDKRDYG